MGRHCPLRSAACALLLAAVCVRRWRARRSAGRLRWPAARRCWGRRWLRLPPAALRLPGAASGPARSARDLAAAPVRWRSCCCRVGRCLATAPGRGADRLVKCRALLRCGRRSGMPRITGRTETRKSHASAPISLFETSHETGPTMYQHIQVPAEGQKISVNEDCTLNVPNHPIILFIEGDGVGVDVTPVMIRVTTRRWHRSTAASAASTGWRSSPARRRPASTAPIMSGCPTRRLEVVRDYLVSIKGPLTTPVGGGIRSLNVALRRARPVRLPAPGALLQGRALAAEGAQRRRHGHLPREPEDIYAGIEYPPAARRRRSSSASCRKRWASRRSASLRPSGLAQPVSIEGTERLRARPSSTRSTMTSPA